MLQSFQEWALAGSIVFGVFDVIHFILHLPFSGIDKRVRSGSIANYIFILVALLVLCAGWASYCNKQGFLIAGHPHININLDITGGLVTMLFAAGFVALSTQYSRYSAFYILTTLLALLLYGAFIVFASLSQQPNVADSVAWAVFSAAPLLLFGTILFVSGSELWGAKIAVFLLVACRLIWWIVSPSATDSIDGLAGVAAFYFFLDLATALFYVVVHFLYADTLIGGIVSWLKGEIGVFKRNKRE